MKLVVLDGYCENPGDLSWAELEALGELSVYDRTAYVNSPLIAARIGDAEIAITNKTPITRSTLEQCPNLRLIAVMATGYNVVDCDCAREMGIAVVNVPTYGTASVAQFAIALLLEVCHHIGHHSRTVSEGRWSDGADWCYWDYPLVELAGKCAGIIGFGRIGQATGQIARALGMEVVACDPHPCNAGSAIAKSNPMKTGVQATKLAIGAFIVPYVFAMSPEMLFIGASVGDIILICITAVLGMFGVAVAMNGFLYVKLNVLFRVAFMAGGLLLLVPGIETDIAGFVILAALTVGMRAIKKRKEANLA